MSFLISRCQLYNKAQDNCPKPKVYNPPEVVNPKNEEKFMTATTTMDVSSSESPKIGISSEEKASESKVMIGRAFADDTPEQEYKPESVSIVGEQEEANNQINNDAHDSILDKKIDIDAQPSSDDTTEENVLVYTIKPQFQVGGYHLTSSVSSIIPSLFTFTILSFALL